MAAEETQASLEAFSEEYGALAHDVDRQKMPAVPGFLRGEPRICEQAGDEFKPLSNDPSENRSYFPIALGPLPHRQVVPVHFVAQDDEVQRRTLGRVEHGS